MNSGLYYIEVNASLVRDTPPRPETGSVLIMTDETLNFANLKPTLPVVDGHSVATLDGFLFSTDEKGEVTHITSLPDEKQMKEQERIFFALCYNLRKKHKPRYVVNLLSDTIPHKRCWYYLAKWERLGFYSCGVTIDLGWFYPEKLPPRYKEIIEEAK